MHADKILSNVVFPDPAAPEIIILIFDLTQPSISNAISGVIDL
ncbi:MAG: hypothetical protein JWN94_1263 [Betaproteobacteria bacterium]|nr:hypothetical protein [Betaproteobacteria bacterium]